MGVFAEHAPAYMAAGLPVFPVNTRAKRPAVRNWQRSGIHATREWIGRHGDADGLGLCMGERSRLVEVDVDAAGPACLAEAIERFGETPVVIRTPSDKHKLWYRHNGERRRIRPISGLPIDVLGAGFTVAPPSYRPDLARSYGFLKGSLADLDRLPPIRGGALQSGYQRAAETVREGERNNVLWRWCMVEARFCDDVDALIDAAQTWACAMPVPLDPREVEPRARSVGLPGEGPEHRRAAPPATRTEGQNDGRANALSRRIFAAGHFPTLPREPRRIRCRADCDVEGGHPILASVAD